MNLVSALQSEKKFGGREGIRTPDPLLAKRGLGSTIPSNFSNYYGFPTNRGIWIFAQR